ncbi:hypothetical protein LC20_08265 [Yersinia hibernica]|uniref:Uncharacterized protein n=1 Tax=Yersinia enterocolitica LC20 TaxID=1443113 RepID=A0A7U5PGU7_YEREN|nr:hypothetical protein LC20_08265 [Yersinia hibernica]
MNLPEVFCWQILRFTIVNKKKYFRQDKVNFRLHEELTAKQYSLPIICGAAAIRISIQQFISSYIF